MSTAVAAPPVTTAPLAPPPVDQSTSSRTYAAIAPSSGTPNSKASRSGSNHGSPSSNETPQRPSSGDRRSPNSSCRSGPAPKIIVKKEPPSSPELQTSRHRPRRLDLSNKMGASQAALTSRPSAPLTAKDSAGLPLQELGLACLSPGFQTQDPGMREALQRSIDVRDQQRQIIEARQKNAKAGVENVSEPNPFRNGAKPPGTSRRKGPPPGLSIAPPSHSQFANERVIQSAPLNQSFTGLRHVQPLSRQVVNQPSSLSHTSHIHHVPATQTNNRLPPITDVFSGEQLGSHRDRNTHSNPSPEHSSHSNQLPPVPSPGFPPHAQQQQQQQPPTSGRPREYKSAEEAVRSLSGGREELLPRIVHYGGHQPPTPPSPMPPKSHNGQNLHPSSSSDTHRSGSSRRRTREEYERDMGTPPLGRQPEPRRGPFGEGRDSPETQRKKKEEFIALCSRAWDLFHS